MDQKYHPHSPPTQPIYDTPYSHAPPPPPYYPSGATYATPGRPVFAPPMPGQMPMPAPAAAPPCEVNIGDGPLSYLAAVDQLIIKQEIHLAEVAINVETNTKFDILNNQGQLVYRAEEDTEFCHRNCASSARGFTINIKDLMGSDIIALKRPCKCCGCCFPCCCLQEMTVEAPPGYPIGTINENWRFCGNSFTIRDERNEAIYQISASCCPGACSVGNDVHFKVIDTRSSCEVGVVSKQWGGIMQEMYTRATNFNVTFPMHLCVQHKAIILSVAFLLNFMFFQRTPHQFRNQDHNHGGSAAATTAITQLGTTTTTFE